MFFHLFFMWVLLVLIVVVSGFPPFTVELECWSCGATTRHVPPVHSSIQSYTAISRLPVILYAANEEDNDDDDGNDDENFDCNFEDECELEKDENDNDDMIDKDNDDEEDEEDVPIKPYGNRSLAWTKRYRKLNPYEVVRERVIRNFGHRSKEDWDECVANGWQGSLVPSRPDEMYAPEWVSWDEFLGIMRSYEDCQNVAVNVLGFKSLDDYILFVRSNPKRAELLRVPVRPDLYFKNKGWVDEATFFKQPRPKEEEKEDGESDEAEKTEGFEFQ